MAEPLDTEPTVHVDGTDVRSGETSGHMRWVLLISIVLAIVILSLLVWGPHLFNH